MNNQKFGEIIAKARKDKGMTQKDLAERLRITDKAISKWERGKGYPEITLLPALSKALDIPTKDLLFDDIEDEAIAPEAETEKLVTGMIQYSGNISRQKFSRIVFPIISAAFALSAFVCLLVNFCVNRAFTWSVFPVASLLLCFVVLIPIFFLKKHRTLTALGDLFCGGGGGGPRRDRISSSKKSAQTVTLSPPAGLFMLRLVHKYYFRSISIIFRRRSYQRLELAALQSLSIKNRRSVSSPAICISFIQRHSAEFSAISDRC